MPEQDYNISNDKSLLGRELLMPDELMRFKFGEAIFMKTRKYPVKAKITTIYDYPIKIKKVPLPSKEKNFEIKYFNLDKFRKTKNTVNDNKIDLI